MSRSSLANLGVLVLVGSAAFLPGLLAGRTLPARDIGATQVPWRVTWAGQLQAGHLPLWDPLSNGGRPLLANPNAMAAYPGSALFLFATPEAAAAWHVALHHLALLLALFVLCRRSGADPAAALLAATAVGTSGLAWSAATFLNLQASLVWAAWALATAIPPPENPVAARRRGVLAGLLLGVSFLAGEPVTAALAALAWVGISASTWTSNRVVGATLAALVAALVAAPVLAPFLATLPETARGAVGVDPGAMAADTLAPRRWLELLFPRVLGEALGDGHTGFWAAASYPWQRFFPLLFIGALPLLLLPWVPRRGRWRPWWALALAGCAGAVVLAWPTAGRLAAALPGGGTVRFGIKLLVLPFLAAAPLLAAAWPALAERWKPWGRRTAAAVTAAGVSVAALGVLSETLARPALAILYPASAPDLAGVSARELRRRMAADGLSLAAPAAVLLAAGPTMPAALAAVAAVNTAAAREVLRWDSRRRWAEPPDSLDRVPAGSVVASISGGSVPAAPHGDRGLARFWAARMALEPNFPSRWGRGTILNRGPDGMEPVLHDQLAVVSRSLPVPSAARLARNLGAAAVITREELPDWECRAAQGVELCVSTGPVPEAYLATRVLTAASLLAVRDTLASPAFRAGADAIVTGERPPEDLAGGSVAVLGGPPHRRAHSVFSAGESLLVVRQNFTGQWRARIGRNAVPVVPVNGCQVGVRLPPGEHLVEVFLDLAPYRIGAAGPLLALLVAAACSRQGRRDGRTPPGGTKVA